MITFLGAGHPASNVAKTPVRFRSGDRDSQLEKLEQNAKELKALCPTPLYTSINLLPHTEERYAIWVVSDDIARIKGVRDYLLENRLIQKLPDNEAKPYDKIYRFNSSLLVFSDWNGLEYRNPFIP